MIQWIHANYPNGVEFIGIKQSASAPVIFFSVRVRAQDHTSSITQACPLLIKWHQDIIKVAAITPETLNLWGVTNRFIGGADPQNRDYGIEFRFSGDSIVEFYARHTWNSSVLCPFSIGSDTNGHMVTFPLSQTELIAQFGSPTNILTVWGH